MGGVGSETAFISECGIIFPSQTLLNIWERHFYAISDEVQKKMVKMSTDKYLVDELTMSK